MFDHNSYLNILSSYHKHGYILHNTQRQNTQTKKQTNTVTCARPEIPGDFNIASLSPDSEKIIGGASYSVTCNEGHVTGSLFDSKMFELYYVESIFHTLYSSPLSFTAL